MEAEQSHRGSVEVLMRYDTPIFFQHELKPKYDATTGDYTRLECDEIMRYAMVMDTTTERLQFYYGTIPQNSKTIILLNHYNRSFNHIRIGDKIYDVDVERKLRHKHTFIVHEVT